MSFLRETVKIRLWHWREVFLLVFTIALCGYLFTTYFGLVRAITIGPIVIALAFLYPAIRQALTAQPAPSVGLVEITERRIRYLGPDTGSEISANDLALVQIKTYDANDAPHDAVWIFEDIHGQRMDIPAGAEGARGLLDAMASLPGADLNAAMRAMACPHQSLFTIWQKGA